MPTSPAFLKGYKTGKFDVKTPDFTMNGTSIQEKNGVLQPPSLKEQGYFAARYLVAFMGFLGMMFNYILRVNMNLTILAMTKPTAKNIEDETDPCGYGKIFSHHSYAGEFEWDEFTQATIVGSFFWGYIITQIPGGRLGEVIGARKTFGYSILFTALFTLLIPFVAAQNPLGLIIVRILMGIAEGPTFPVTHALTAPWSPPLERSIMSAIIFAGSQAGTVFVYPMSAAIIDSFGWRYVFIIQGILGIIWCGLWFFIMTDEPEDFRWISRAEVDYIHSSLVEVKEKKAIPVPWKSILTSVPFWTLMCANFCGNWGFWCLMTQLPLYMKTMLKKNLKSNAWFSGLPYLGMWIFCLILSSIGDKLRLKGILSSGVLRKLSTAIAHGVPCICLICLSFVQCNRAVTLAMLYISVACQGAMYSGYLVNHLDIAPNFGATLYGITNMLGGVASFLAPLTAGSLVNNNPTFEQWEKVFWITAGIYLFNTTIFTIFGTAKEQEWNKPKLEDAEKNKSYENEAYDGNNQ